MAPISKIILTGSVSIDRIMNFSGSYKDLIQPDKIHVISLSVLIDQLQNTHGGIAANIAYTLALLGDKPVLAGFVGHDAREYIKHLKKVGVDTSRVHYSDKSTSTFTVMTDRDDNQIGGFFPGAMEDNAKLLLSDFVQPNTLLIISANDPSAMSSLVNQSKASGIPYMYDVSQQVSNISDTDIMNGIKNAQITIVNDYEREVIVNKCHINNDELPNLSSIFITTLGGDGAIIEGNTVKRKIKVKAAIASKITDPTGAGDAFRAGFLYGFKRDMPLEQCAQIGAVAAVYAIEKHGTQSHTFSHPEFNKRLSNNFGFTIDH